MKISKFQLKFFAIKLFPTAPKFETLQKEDFATNRRIMTNDPLQSMPQLEQSFSGRSGQVTSPKLQNLQTHKREEGQGCGIPGRRWQDRNDLQRREMSQNPSKLLKCAVITKVIYISSQIVNGCSSK